MEHLGDFLARPTSFFGTRSGGTTKAPGFHTTDSQDIALAYSVMKVQHLLPPDWQRETRIKFRKGIPDAPVIVSLDMSGLDPQPDIDAEYAISGLYDLFREFADDLKRRPLRPPDDLVDRFGRFTEIGGFEPMDDPDDIMEMIFMISTPGPQEFGGIVASLLETMPRSLANQHLERAMRGIIDPFLVMRAIGQYRYVEDVSSRRITGVVIYSPWIDCVYPSWDDEDYPEDEVKAAEKAGYTVVSLGDWYDGVFPRREVASWERRPSHMMQLQFEGMEMEPRIEHHGTSLANLVLAAPEFGRMVDEIPPPFNPKAFLRRLEGA